MTAIVTQIEIDAPHAEVFDYVTDPAHFTDWQEKVVGGHLDTGQPEVGSLCHTTRRIGGAERDVTSKITTYDPPTAWSVHGIDGPIRSTVDVTVEPLQPTRSRLTITLDFEGHGLGKLLVPLLVKPQARKEMPRNVARLKSNLESTR